MKLDSLLSLHESDFKPPNHTLPSLVKKISLSSLVSIYLKIQLVLNVS